MNNNVTSISKSTGLNFIIKPTNDTKSFGASCYCNECGTRNDA